jgi:23S rRNA pseudouridine2604 synthase
VVEVEESVARKKAEREFYAYHKPAGVSTDPELKGDNIVQKNIRLKKKVYSLDRLDTDMHGILLLSTDERIRDLLLNPRFAAEQEYIVKVHRPIDKKFIDRLRAGVMINKTLVRPISCEQVAEQTFRITLLHEPYHNVRSICLALHYEPIDILRVRIKNVELRHLKEGEWRLLEGKERADFLQSIGE